MGNRPWNKHQMQGYLCIKVVENHSSESHGKHRFPGNLGQNAKKLRQKSHFLLDMNFWVWKDYIQIHYACNEGKKSLSRSHPGSFCVSLSHVLKSFLFGEDWGGGLFFLLSHVFHASLVHLSVTLDGPFGLNKKVRDTEKKKALLWWLISQLFSF